MSFSLFSAPVIWIVFPALVAMIAFFFRRWKTPVTITLTLITFLLALFAWLVEIGELQVFGSWAFTITDRLVFAGRLFVLGNVDRPILMLVYLTLTFFFSGALFAKVSKIFLPMGLAMSAVLIASLAVRPFLYAALLIEVAVLIGVPLLSPPGKKIERGVLRYMVFLSFGFPFMLIGGGLLSRAALDTSDLASFFPALIILSFGFAFLLAVFPLNTWIPVLLEYTHPYPAAFLFSIFPTIVIALLLRFTEQYPWLLDFEVIQFLGTLTVIAGGAWAAFQRDLGRLLGYAVIVEIGYSLLAITLPDGLALYMAMFLPRILALGIWSLSLSLIRRQVDDLSFRSVQGLGRRIPLVALGALVAHFSLAGIPLLASFPILLAIWGQIVQTSAALAFLLLLSSVGLMAGALRSLAVFVMGPEEMPQLENQIGRAPKLLLLLGIFALVMAGLFPQWFYGLFAGIIGLV